MNQPVRVITHAPALTGGPVDIVLRPTTPASRTTKLGRLKNALLRWNAAGRPLASRDLRRARLAACAQCEFWNPAGNLGLGACKAPGCGCSKFKAWLLTEICPHPAGSRWPAQMQPPFQAGPV